MSRASSVPKSLFVAVTATSEPTGHKAHIWVNRAYTDALTAVGLIPLVVPPMPAEMAPQILDGVGGLVLTGGEDIEPSRFGASRHPATGEANQDRDRGELALAKEAAARRIPTLAICRGVQILNVALGGTLIQDLPSDVGSRVDHDAESSRNTRVHPVAVSDGSRLADIVGARSIATNSFHHQAVGKLASDLRAVATSPDGVVEAVECADRAWWAVGVQWHPEELTETPEEWDRRLFSAFAAAVKDLG
jgi:putative glutamine amidotransferase